MRGRKREEEVEDPPPGCDPIAEFKLLVVLLIALFNPPWCIKLLSGVGDPIGEAGFEAG